MKIKLIASDIDGTIVNESHTVSQRTIDAVKKAREAGIHFMLSTGRAYETTADIINELGLENEEVGLVCLNGMETYRLPENTTKRKEGLNYKECQWLQKVGHKYHMGIMYCFDNNIYFEMDERSLKDYTIAMGEEMKTYFNFKIKMEPIDDLSDIESVFEKESIQKIAYIQSADYMGLVIDRMKNDVDGNYELMRVGEGWTEVGTLGVNKGQAVLEYAASLDIKPEEIMVFGDSENDVSMFKVAGTAVAMENAIGTAKEHANAFTLSNKDDGVAVYIEQYLDSQK